MSADHLNFKPQNPAPAQPRAASELSALIERLKNATGRDTELDIAIGRFIHGPNYQFINGYTASLDAALTLVPEGWWAEVFARADQPSCRLYETQLPCRKIPDEQTMWGNKVIVGVNLPIALCIAALKARASIEEAKT